jgi:MoxR-like ATPase
MAYIGKSEDTKQVLDILEAGRLTQTPCILWGPPGVGKTELVRAIAARNNLPLFILLASTMDPTDINGLPAIKEMIIERPTVEYVQELNEDGTVITDMTGQPVVTEKYGTERSSVTVTEPTLQYWSEALIREGRGVLFFDEANNAVPSVQSTLLSVLQGRVVGRHTLPDDVWMIAASNDTADGADAWELAAPMANRFLHIEYRPNFNDWAEGMSVGWEKPTPKGLDTVKLQQERSIVTQFLKQHNSLWNAMPKDDAQRGKAWPSPRTWDKLSAMLAVIPKNREGSRFMAINGLVGEAAAVQYSKFLQGLRLPKYEDIMANPEKIEWSKLKAAEVRIILDMLIANMDAENFENTLKVTGVIAEEGGKADMVAAVSHTLHERLGIMHRQKRISPKLVLELMTKYAPFLKEAKID